MELIIELAWLAGIIDSDGCISLQRSQNIYSSVVQITNTDTRMITRVRSILDNLNVDYTIATRKMPSVNHATVHHIRVRKQLSVIVLLTLIEKFLVNKRDRALILLKYCMYRRGQKIKPKLSKIDDCYFTKMRELQKAHREYVSF